MAFCRNCGAQLADGSAFCSGCGSSTATTTTSTSMPTTAGAPAPAPLATTTTSAPMTSNVAGALSYIVIVGIVFLIIDPYKRDRFVRFHAFQAIFFTVAVIIVFIVLGILASGTLFLSGAMFTLMWGLYLLFRLAVFVCWVFLVFKAYNNEKFKLPVIGDIAEKQAAQG
jgi:uncharacterized membrane protein